MNGSMRLLALALIVLAAPMAAQQEVPMRGNTPVAPQGIKIPPLPDAPVDVVRSDVRPRLGEG